jgi:hypothetical protein
MRCKVGDLAIRIKAFDDSFVKAGSLVRCLRLNNFTVMLHGSQSSLPTEANNTWDVEWNGRLVDDNGWRMAIPDEHLQPIGNPGEDARDETLLWLPVPSREEVSA